MKLIILSQWKNLLILVLLVPLSDLSAGRLELVLPTDNKGIFSSDPSRFYMYTDRHFEGANSKPWTGGKYGYVRNQKRTKEGMIFTRFHEGIDIAPVKRDRSRRALDKVRAIGKGRVVHVNTLSGRSSYGRYVVVEHDWGNGPFFSLYGHLEKIDVKVGQRLPIGQSIGQMGCTGWAGSRNVERSHLHLELNLMIHDQFPRWHDQRFADPNHHGDFNGLNLIGLDIADLYLRLRENPNLTIPEFVAEMQPYFRVAFPKNGGDMQLLKRYPWLWKGPKGGNVPSFEITLSRSSIPLAIEASTKKVVGPTVTWVEDSSLLHAYATMGRLNGIGKRATLSDSGKSFLNLLTGRF